MSGALIGLHRFRFGPWAILSFLIGVVLVFRWIFGSPSGPEAGGFREHRAESLWWSNFENGLSFGSSSVVPAVARIDGNLFDASSPPLGVLLTSSWNALAGHYSVASGAFWLNFFSILLMAASFRRFRESGWVIVVSVSLFVTSPYLLNSFYTPVSSSNFLLLFFGLALLGLRNYEEHSRTAVFVVSVSLLPLISWAGAILTSVLALQYWQSGKKDELARDRARVVALSVGVLPGLFIIGWLALASRSPGIVFGRLVEDQTSAVVSGITNLSFGWVWDLLVGLGAGLWALLFGRVIYSLLSPRTSLFWQSRCQLSLVSTLAFAFSLLAFSGFNQANQPEALLAFLPLAALVVTGSVSSLLEGLDSARGKSQWLTPLVLLGALSLNFGHGPN